MNNDEYMEAEQRERRRQAEAAQRRRQLLEEQQSAGAQRRPGVRPPVNRPPGGYPAGAAGRQPGYGSRSSRQEQTDSLGGNPPGRRRPRSQNRWFSALLMVAAALGACIFLSIFVLQSASDLFGLNQPDEDIPVTVPEGSTVAEVSGLLREAGVVDQPLTFRLYFGFNDVKDEEMQPGSYIFNSNMSYEELMIALRAGRTSKEEKRLTFTEGMTLLEIATQLEEEGICGADELMGYLDAEDFAYEFYGAIDDNPLRYHKLEGYIFPDTYDFYMGENVDSVARKFLRNMNEKLTPDLLSRMQNMNMSIDETLTLASIIQKEAGNPDDMRLVSSVFHNRLDSGESFPNLESDVTILYVESDIKPRETLTNQAMYDSYNTYVCEGLPAGPISNPGINAITAALYPEQTDIPYYFFVTDAEMEFYYAATAQQHYDNIETAAQIGEYHGTGTQ